MSIGAGIALVAVGAILAFMFTGHLFGVDPDVLGLGLMIVGILVLASALLRRRRGDRPPRHGA